MAPIKISANPFAALAMHDDSDNESSGSQSPTQADAPVIASQDQVPSTPSAMPVLSRTVSRGFDWAADVEDELAADQDYRRRQSAGQTGEQEHGETEEQDGQVTCEEVAKQDEYPEETLKDVPSVPKGDDETAESQSDDDVAVVEDVTNIAEAPQAISISKVEDVSEIKEAGTDKDVTAVEPLEAREEAQQTSSSSSSGEEHDTGVTSPAPETSPTSPQSPIRSPEGDECITGQVSAMLLAKEGDTSGMESEVYLEEHWLSKKSSIEDLLEQALQVPLPKDDDAVVAKQQKEVAVSKKPSPRSSPAVAVPSFIDWTSTYLTPVVPKPKVQRPEFKKVKKVTKVVNVRQVPTADQGAMSILQMNLSAPLPAAPSSAASTTDETSSESARPRRVATKATEDAEGLVVPASRKVARGGNGKSTDTSSVFVVSSKDGAEDGGVASPMSGDTGAALVDDAPVAEASSTTSAPFSRRKNRRTHAQRKAAKRATQAAQTAPIGEEATPEEPVDVPATKEDIHQGLPEQLMPSMKHRYLGAVKFMAASSAILAGTCAIIVAMIKVCT